MIAARLRQLQAVQLVDQRKQAVDRPRQIDRQGGLGVFAIGVVRRGHPFQRPRLVQPAARKFQGFGRVMFIGGILAVRPAVRAVDDLGVGRGAAPLPQKSLRLDHLVAAAALRLVQLANVQFEAFFPLVAGRQFRQRMAQFGGGGRVGVHFEQKARHRVVRRHQHPPAGARRLQRQPGRGPEGIQHPAVWRSIGLEMGLEPLADDARRDGRQITAQRRGRSSFALG